MGRNKKDRVGEKFVSNEDLGAYEFIIVEYNNCEDVWVELQDEHKARVHTNYQCCKNGSVKNPYHPNVYEHGFLGLMSDGSKPKTSNENGTKTREYTVWQSMIQRVYDPKLHERFPSYKGSILEDCLHCFAYFLEHIHLIPNYEYWLNHPSERVALDKDIRGKGNKVYSLDTIMFVPQSENTRERLERCGNSFGSQPTKVYGINIKTSEKTKVFESMSEASRELGINYQNISHCLNGKLKTTGGYTWHKIED